MMKDLQADFHYLTWPSEQPCGLISWMSKSQDQERLRDLPKVTSEISEGAIPRRSHLSDPFHYIIPLPNCGTMTVRERGTHCVTRTTPALPRRRRLTSVPSSSPVRTKLYPTRQAGHWSAQSRDKADSADPSGPASLPRSPGIPGADETRLGHVCTPSQWVSPPPGSKERAGSEPEGGGPPEPAMCSDRHARLARPAPHGQTAATGPLGSRQRGGLGAAAPQRDTEPGTAGRSPPHPSKLTRRRHGPRSQPGRKVRPAGPQARSSR